MANFFSQGERTTMSNEISKKIIGILERKRGFSPGKTEAATLESFLQAIQKD